MNVDGNRNGGIRVKGEGRSDVLVRACVQTMGATEEEARSIAKSIRIETGSTIQATGSSEAQNWAVSYEILVPRNTNLKLAAHNGGLNVALTGNSWRGSGLDVQTTNGGVNLQMSENYAAHVETGTVNGGFKSTISGLNIASDDDENGRNRKKRISTDLNGGGATIRVITTNGGIRINSTADKSM